MRDASSDPFHRRALRIYHKWVVSLVVGIPGAVIVVDDGVKIYK